MTAAKPGSRPPAELIIWLLMLAQSSGVTAVLPVLPLYAAHHGASLRFVGLMVGAYTAANMLGLYPAGWLADRLGRRWLMAVGMVGFALASLGFLVWTLPAEMAVLRVLEGFAGACFAPAAMAYATDHAPPGRQGSRIASLIMAQNTGMLIGPMLGAVVATAWGLAAPFVAMALLAAAGAIAVAWLPAQAPRSTPAAEAPVGSWREVDLRTVAGIALRTVAGGYAMGLYESIWGLHLQTLGASVFQINLTWVLFALPAVLLARVAGGMIDRHGPRSPAIWGTAFSSLVVIGYALTPRIEYLIGLGMIDSLGFAFGYPAVNAAMVQAAPEKLRGRVIGTISALSPFGALMGALIVPILYERSVLWCFASVALLLGGSALLMAIVLPRTASRVAHG